MRRARIALLLALLFVVAMVFYVQRAARVRVETVRLESRALGRAVSYDVVLPPGYDLLTERRTRYTVLYLLHGWGGNHASWLSSTSLKDYAALHRLIIVTPEGGNGWYTDSATEANEKFETYFVEELIPDVERRFRAAPTRAARSVAGNSMGGYGAIKFGLKHPELFALAASTSGAFDAATRTDDDSLMRVFGPADSDARSANDIFKLAREFPAERRAALPFLYFDCGTKDPWLASNRALADLLLERGIAHEFRQLPGEHKWGYWDRQLQGILRLTEELAPPP